MDENEEDFLQGIRNDFEEKLLEQSEVFQENGLNLIGAVTHAYEQCMDAWTKSKDGRLTGLPPFDENGYLPALHQCDIDEFQRTFGLGTPVREAMMSRLFEVFELCKQVEAKKVMIGGSFVTMKEIPGDVDVTALVPDNFFQISKQNQQSPQHQLNSYWKEEADPIAPEVDLSIEQTAAGFWSLFRLYFVPKDVAVVSDGQILYTGLVEVIL